MDPGSTQTCPDWPAHLRRCRARFGRELILSVYNLASGAEKDIRLDAKVSPESGEITPF